MGIGRLARGCFCFLGGCVYAGTERWRVPARNGAVYTGVSRTGRVRCAMGSSRRAGASAAVAGAWGWRQARGRTCLGPRWGGEEPPEPMFARGGGGVGAPLLGFARIARAGGDWSEMQAEAGERACRVYVASRRASTEAGAGSAQFSRVLGAGWSTWAARDVLPGVEGAYSVFAGGGCVTRRYMRCGVRTGVGGGSVLAHVRFVLGARDTVGLPWVPWMRTSGLAVEVENDEHPFDLKGWVVHVRG
ncbi:hypothetical protein C8F04DRAFT_1192917 [Mycena alexandri]|uniref:Uncharacterized protein n=1 Tax=Mycena alexandri TaxID=1745969 RepID=A0AAD6SC46_9AGAR|nr:hypothetical protein C8F04DRAFT_1192917 [Mycena alexandri]